MVRFRWKASPLWLLFFFGVLIRAQYEESFRKPELQRHLYSKREYTRLKPFLDPIDWQVFPTAAPDQTLFRARRALEISLQEKNRMAEGFAWRAIGFAQYKLGSPEKALEYYANGREAFASIGAWYHTAIMYFEMANLWFYCFSASGPALDYYQKSLALYGKLSDLYGQVKSLNLMGEVHRTFGRYSQAIDFYIEALKRSERNNTPLLIRKRAVIQTNLSDMYLLLEDIAKAEEYLHRAELIYRRENLRIETAQLFTRRGDIAKHEGRLDTALDFYRQALAIRREWHPDHPEIAVEIHKIADTHSLSGQVAEADRFFAEALALRKQIRDLPGTAQTLLAIGVHQQRQNKIEKARPYFQESLVIAQENGLIKEIQEAARALADLHAREQDGVGELRYRKIADDAAARLQSPKISADMMKRLLGYESGEEIKRFQTKRRQTILQLITILVLLILTLVFLSSRHRKTKQALQSNREQLEEQQTQLAQLKQRVKDMETPAVQARYHNSKLSWEQEQSLLKRLIAAMETQELYLDSDLSLLSLAEKMGVNRSYLSQVINHSTGKTFSDFINSFRIEAAKALIEAMDKRETSILDVCFDAGFNNKTVFNRVFKKMTGQTPSEYRKTISGKP